MKRKLFFWEGNTLKTTPYFDEIVKSRLFDDKFLARLSIKKWQKILLHRIQIGSHGFIEEQGHDTCALCHQYFRAAECNGCPIMWITKHDSCSYTPYTSNPTLLEALAEVLFLYFVYFTVWVRIGTR